MQIPAFKKTADTDDLAVNPVVSKPLPTLAAVRITYSRFGHLLYRCSYGVFALSLLWVFYPFIVERPHWLLVLIPCWGGLWWGYREQIKGFATGALGFVDGYWTYECEEHNHQFDLGGEVLCWSWLIILPLRNTASGKTRQLLLFGDALNKVDNARLRRWLRACLVPKA